MSVKDSIMHDMNMYVILLKKPLGVIDEPFSFNKLTRSLFMSLLWKSEMAMLSTREKQSSTLKFLFLTIVIG